MRNQILMLTILAMTTTLIGCSTGPLPECEDCRDSDTGSVDTDTNTETDTGCDTDCVETDSDTDVVIDPLTVDDDGDGWTEAGLWGADGYLRFDCDDTNFFINPDVSDQPQDGIDQNCDGVDGLDFDHDTFASVLTGGDDCDDVDVTTHPGATEVWYEGHANDCREGWESWSDFDQDEDGVSSPDDCADTDDTIYPGVFDMPNDGADQNCTGETGFNAEVVWAPDSNSTLTITLTDLIARHVDLTLHAANDAHISTSPTRSENENDVWGSGFGQAELLQAGIDNASPEGLTFELTGTATDDSEDGWCVYWGVNLNLENCTYLEGI